MPSKPNKNCDYEPWPLVTVSQLVLELDAAKADKRFSVLKFNVGERKPWEYAPVLAEICKAGPVRSVARTDDGLAYALVEGEVPYGGVLAFIDGEETRGVRVRWANVEPYIALRLLFNSCAQTAGESDGVPNNTGRLFAVSGKNSRDKIETVETEIGKDCIATLRIRSFTRRKLLLKLAAKNVEEQRKINRAPGYERTPWGSMIYSNKRDDDFIIRKPWGSKPAKRREWTFSGDEAQIAQTKKAILLRQLKAIEYRYGDFVRVILKTYPRESFYEIQKSESYKNAVAEKVGNVQLVVSAAREGLEGSARLLVESINEMDSGIRARYCSKGLDPNGWNVIVVPDKESEDDGYALDKGVIEQHISESLCEPGKTPKAIKAFAAMVGNICKELLVKQDVVQNRVQAFDLTEFGIDSLEVCSLGRMRIKGKDKVTDWPIYIWRLAIGLDGVMQYSQKPVEEGLAEPIEMAALSSRTDNGIGACAFEVCAGTKHMLARIEDTGLVTYPNEYKRLYDDYLMKGESGRGRDMFETFYAPFYGMGTFRIDGVLHYYVGCDNGVQMKMPTAVHVRKIEVVEGDDLTEMLVRLANVGLSRYGRPSMWPIPVKYLHEYAAREMGYVGEQLELDLGVSTSGGA